MKSKKLLVLLIIIMLGACSRKPYYISYKDLRYERLDFSKEYIITGCPDTVILKFR